MARILHTGDLHINALRRFRSHYLKRMEETLDLIHDVAEEEDVDYIVVAGDVFERLDVLHEERLLLSKWIAASPVPLIMISGNHDRRTDEIGDTVLSYLARIKMGGDHCVQDGFPSLVVYPKCVFLLVPYNNWTDSEFYLVLDYLVPKASKENLPLVVVLHEAVTGAIYDNGMTTSRNEAIRMKTLPLDFPQVTYWALGDMHSCQKVAPAVWYAGAPHQTKFGETEGKGVLVVDTDAPDDPTFIELETMSLVDVHEVSKSFNFKPDVLYKLRPNHTLPSNLYLPENVEVDVKIPQNCGEITAPETMVDIFYGLDNALLRAGLKRDLVPLGVQLAEEAARKLHIRTEAMKQGKDAQ